jgi:hypothetical protein
MTSTITDVFAQAGYSVATRMVERVDNQGEPCEVCQVEGRYVDATVYGENNGVATTIDCCVVCVPEVIRDLDSSVDVTVELGDSLDDDRMHGQDCTCAHPDAL